MQFGGTQGQLRRDNIYLFKSGNTAGENVQLRATAFVETDNLPQKYLEIFTELIKLNLQRTVVFWVQTSEGLVKRACVS